MDAMAVCQQDIPAAAPSPRIPLPLSALRALPLGLACLELSPHPDLLRLSPSEKTLEKTLIFITSFVQPAADQ